MSSDTATTEWVTFRHPFALPGLEQPHNPGTFEVRVRQSSWTFPGPHIF